MRNLILIVTLVIFANTLLAQNEATTAEVTKPDLTEAFRLIDIWLEGQKDYDKLPGISVGVIQDQDLIYAKGFGQANPDKKIATESKTIYSICSISKLFTAVAIMKLYDEEKLRLDDKVADLLPWFDLKQQYKDSGPITVRSLLTHSSGLPREANAPYWTGPDFPFPTQEKVKTGLKQQETLYPASTYFQYSNLGLTLLGEIVETITGVPYETYIQDEILTPLRLANTRTNMPESLYGQQLSIGYSALKRDGNRNKVNLFHAKGITPAAGFSSTVEDLANFAAWQFRLLTTGETEILKPSTLKNMHRVHWMNPDWKTTWGLGFSVYEADGTTLVGHGGACPGYRSTLVLNPKKKIALVAMINANGTNPSKYTRAIGSIIGKAMEGTVDTLDGVNLEDYAGRYSPQPWWSEVIFLPWKGKLVTFSLPSTNPANEMELLKHIEGDTFRRIRKDKTLGEAFIFERDASGKVVRVKQHTNYSQKIE